MPNQNIRQQSNSDKQTHQLKDKLRTVPERSSVSSIMRKILSGILDFFWSMHTKPVSEDLLRANLAHPPLELKGIEELAFSQNRNPFTKWWHYFEIYENELGFKAKQSRENKLAQPLRILEIGVWKGGSLQLWRSFFGENAVIFGIDIDEASRNQGVTDAEIRIGSQADTAFLKSVVAEMGGLDIVIDDGSHVSKDVIHTLTTLFPLLSTGGSYIIEDLHTSYWPKFGGGLRRKTASIEVLKSIIDSLNQPYFSKSATRKDLDSSRWDVGSIQFFDSVVIIRKSTSQKPALFFNPGQVSKMK